MSNSLQTNNKNLTQTVINQAPSTNTKNQLPSTNNKPVLYTGMFAKIRNLFTFKIIGIVLFIISIVLIFISITISKDKAWSISNLSVILVALIITQTIIYKDNHDVLKYIFDKGFVPLYDVSKTASKGVGTAARKFYGGAIAGGKAIGTFYNRGAGRFGCSGSTIDSSNKKIKSTTTDMAMRER